LNIQPRRGWKTMLHFSVGFTHGYSNYSPSGYYSPETISCKAFQAFL